MCCCHVKNRIKKTHSCTAKSCFSACITALIFLLPACEKEQPAEKSPGPKTVRWDFDDLAGWVDGSQNGAGPQNYTIENGRLRIFTKPRSWDRAKVRTKDNTYKAGRYNWRIYVPAMGPGDQASIGAFLYHDDGHELDFEIGYGRNIERQALGAAKDDLIVFTTSQANPYHSKKHLIKRENWYAFSLQLDLTGSDSVQNYKVGWIIDDKVIDQIRLFYGPQFSFYIFCSVENLKFIGDHIPYQLNYALFDHVEFVQ